MIKHTEKLKTSLFPTPANEHNEYQMDVPNPDPIIDPMQVFQEDLDLRDRPGSFNFSLYLHVNHAYTSL